MVLQDGKVSQAQQVCLYGAGIRSVQGTETGYAYTMDLSEEALTKAARFAGLAPSPLPLWGSAVERRGRGNEALPKRGSGEGASLGPAGDRRTQLFCPPDVPALPSFVVRMSDDVLQFAEAPRSVIILDENGEPLKAGDPHRFFEASWMHKANGRYYFSYSTGDSHLLCLAVGDNPYGPFRFKCELLQPVVGWTTHHSIVRYEGRWWLFHHDCVPSNDITHLRSLKVMPLDDTLFE